MQKKWLTNHKNEPEIYMLSLATSDVLYASLKQGECTYITVQTWITVKLPFKNILRSNRFEHYMQESLNDEDLMIGISENEIHM